MKYWDKAWSLVEGCTPVSEACDHCWLAGIEHRFGVKKSKGIEGTISDGTASGYQTKIPSSLTDGRGAFNGTVRIRPDRLNIPLKSRKPTVFAVWSDLFHKKVPSDFITHVMVNIKASRQHAFIILTKRPKYMADYLGKYWPEGIDDHV